MSLKLRIEGGGHAWQKMKMHFHFQKITQNVLGTAGSLTLGMM